ncbi:MAG: AAA family ATPase [Phycisphaerae bacterium]
MLIEFKVKNFKCFREQAVLDLRPAKQDKELLGNIWEGNKGDAVKSAAIFGPNASGKTSMLEALQVLRRFVAISVTSMNAGDPIPGIKPYLLSKTTSESPTEFYVEVELEGVGYIYELVVSQKAVFREILKYRGAKGSAKWIKLIDRDLANGTAKLHEKLIGSKPRRDQLVADTRDNALFLSRAAERNVGVVKPLFLWFRNGITHVDASEGLEFSNYELTKVAKAAREDPSLLTKLTELVRDADTGIARIRTETVDPATRWGMPGAKSEQKEAEGRLTEALKQMINALEDVHPGALDDALGTSFYTEHVSQLGELLRFDLMQESSGTKQYLWLSGMLIMARKRPTLFLVDELHTSLHPMLSTRLVQMVNSPELGNGGTQFIFTTHDVTLLNPSLLRRDQIYLTQKNSKGSAEIYSLWDFEDMPRNNAAWGRNYLAGRFGGIPVFGPSLADIPQADAPTRVHSETVGAK